MKKVQQTNQSAFFILILAAIMLFGCDKSNEMERLDSYNLDVAVDFSVFNSKNEDLLNPENPNHINQANIEILYVIDGKAQKVYNSLMDYPKNFMVYKHANEYRIRVFPNFSETEEKQITYIQWSNSDTDTIEVTIKQTQNSILQDKIWLNGELIWERGDNTTDAYFVLTK